jgi:hypothetical protein
MDKKTQGRLAVENKRGIHGLPLETRKQHGAKANKAFLSKWENEEFKKLHSDKIRLGKLIARWNRLPKADFGFY